MLLNLVENDFSVLKLAKRIKIGKMKEISKEKRKNYQGLFSTNDAIANILMSNMELKMRTSDPSTFSGRSEFHR